MNLLKETIIKLSIELTLGLQIVPTDWEKWLSGCELFPFNFYEDNFNLRI